MWKNRNIWLLMTGETVAGFGMWIGIIGNLEFLQHTVPSDTLKSLIILIGMFVGVLLGPAAGRLIDTISKKTILNAAGLLRIVSVLFMFAAIATDQVWWMVLYMLLLGISGAYYFPAIQATIPLVTPKEKLMQVNSFYMTVSTLARVLGTAFGGVLLVYMSLFQMYLWTIISYIILFLLTLLLRIDEKPKAHAAAKTAGKSSGAAGFKEVWPMLQRTPAVLSALLLTLVPALFLGGFNLVILEISELLGDVSIKGWLYTTEGICFLLGSALVKKLSGNRNLLHLLLGCTFAFAAAHLGLIFGTFKPLAVFAFGLFGFTAGVFFPLVTTLFQKEVDSAMHGRFFSLRGMLDRVSFQLVLVATGILLDLVGYRTMEIIFAFCSLSLAGYYTMKQLRRSQAYRQKPIGEEPSA